MAQFEAFPQWVWNVPEFFNIGVACTDAHVGTANEHKIAMIVEDDVHGTTSISYLALAERTSRFAQLLRNLGVDVGDRVLVRLPNNLDYPTAFLGTMKRGGIAVPTSTLLTGEEVLYLAKDSGAVALVTDKAMWASIHDQLEDLPSLKYILLSGAGEIVGSHTHQVIDLEASLAEIENYDAPHQTKPSDPAYLVYTSGTTGYPKGVLHAHRALIGRKPATDYWFDFDPSGHDRIMHSGKFNWTYVLGSALMDPLYLAKTVVVYEGKNDASTWIDLIAKHHCTIFIGVPTIYRQIIQKTNFTKENVPTLRHCMSAGEHLSDEMLHLWEERFGRPIFEAVGMSEFSYYLSQSKYRPIRAGSAGFPQPGHDIKLLDPETLQEVPVGEEGMICVPDSDPGLFLEYWQLPEETAKLRHDGYFFTGDYAKYDEDGYIWFLGRKDDIIKSFGYRVSPYEIERVMKGNPDVADCACIGEEIEKDKLIVVAYIVVQPESKATPNELFEYAKHHLAGYKAPKRVYLVKDYPRTKNGKILRRQLTPALAYDQSTGK